MALKLFYFGVWNTYIDPMAVVAARPSGLLLLLGKVGGVLGGGGLVQGRAYGSDPWHTATHSAHADANPTRRWTLLEDIADCGCCCCCWCCCCGEGVDMAIVGAVRSSILEAFPSYRS